MVNTRDLKYNIGNLNRDNNRNIDEDIKNNKSELGKIIITNAKNNIGQQNKLSR